MENFGTQRCKTLCWVASALLGLFVVYLLRHYWDMSFLWALLFGLLSFFALGWLIPLFACPMEEFEMPVRRMPTPVHVQPKPAPTATPSPAIAPVAATASAVREKAAAPKRTSTKPVAGPKSAKAKAAAAPKPAAAKGKPTAPANVAAGAAEPVAKPAGKSAKPAGLTAARGGKPDDLKVIVGIGPKMEILLNKLGYFHFDQIAAWKAAEVAWVDDNLEGFKGRVTRDNWLAQAKKLAKG